jgi:hypothetical protein
MWPFHSPPQTELQQRYKWSPSDDWLRRLQHAAVRMGDGGSGSFVSDRGLLLTNHHVARGQIHKLSSADRDLIRDGFYAPSASAELPCPDLEASVLDSYVEVTAAITAAGQAGRAGGSDADAHARRKAAMAAQEQRCASQTGLRCEVVTLYGGGQYWLYRYRRYTDVRLVFAPEEQAAAFGGEYDNFTYPRYALDFALLRVYDHGQPLATPQSLRLRAQPVSEGELVLVAGHPATTSRDLTIAQLRYHRDVQNPLQLAILEARLAALATYEQRGTEERRRASALRSQLENQLKRLRGQQAGLRDPAAFARKERSEQALRQAIEKRPELRARFGDPFGRIAAAYQGLPAEAKRLAYGTLAPSRLAQLGLLLWRYPVERAKPDSDRFEEFRDSRLASLRMQLLSVAPTYLDLEEAILGDWLAQGQRALGDRDPLIVAALGGQPAATVAHTAIAGSQLHAVGFRQALLDGGAAAISASQDPLLLLIRRLDPLLRRLRQLYDERIQSVETAAAQRIAAARFAIYGSAVYPDATFTLRLGYGQPLGYEKDTRLVPFQTLFYGLYDRALSFGQKPPYQLAPQLLRARQSGQLDLATPLNFVYSADTIGGNSGSPVVDRNGDVVGLNFDSNLEKLPNRYYYVAEPAGSRAVAVHAAAILAALDKVYGASALVGELRPARSPLPVGQP